MRKIVTLLAAASALIMAAPAAASTYVFDITGDFLAHFTIDSNAVPNSFPGVDNTVWFKNVGGLTINGRAQDAYFYTSDIGGGLGLKNSTNSTFTFVSDGPQLFTGSVTAPTFNLGTFALTQFSGGGRYSLTISNSALTAAVPEPATWAMMLLGFGGIGFSMRRQRKTLIAA